MENQNNSRALGRIFGTCRLGSKECHYINRSALRLWISEERGWGASSGAYFSLFLSILASHLVCLGGCYAGICGAGRGGNQTGRFENRFFSFVRSRRTEREQKRNCGAYYASSHRNPGGGAD